MEIKTCLVKDEIKRLSFLVTLHRYGLLLMRSVVKFSFSQTCTQVFCLKSKPNRLRPTVLLRMRLLSCLERSFITARTWEAQKISLETAFHMICQLRVRNQLEKSRRQTFNPFQTRSIHQRTAKKRVGNLPAQFCSLTLTEIAT